MKFTPERTDKIINLIKAGNYKETAAEASGIAESTLYKWLQEGRDKLDPAKKEFSEAVKKAEMEAEARNVMTIQKASEKNWQAAAWWLERTKYRKWGRKDKIEFTGEDGKPIKHEIIIRKEKNELIEE